MFLIVCAEYLLTTAAFLVFEAKSIFEYGFVFYMLITAINTTSIYLIFVWQSANTYKFIENFEGFLERSE